MRKWEVNTNSYFYTQRFTDFLLHVFFELIDEVRILFCDGTHEKFILREKLNEFSWLCKISYLADLFTHLNVLNLKLRGPDTNIFVVEDKIEAMIEKLKLWVNRVERKSYTSLPVLQKFLTKSEDNLPVEVQDMIVKLMTDFASALRKYFPTPNKNIFIPLIDSVYLHVYQDVLC